MAAILSPQANNIRTKQYTCAEGGKAEKWRETGFLVMSLTWEPPYHRALCYVKQSSRQGLMRETSDVYAGGYREDGIGKTISTQ